MAALSIQTLTEAGLEATFASATGGGDTFVNPNDERTFLWIVNGSGGDITVTFNRQPTTLPVSGHGNIPLTDRAVVVTAGEERLIGPFPAAMYNNASGAVEVSYSGVTSLTVAAIRMPRAG
ncbi:MAG: hypothetical protein GC206_13470 [Alphaproteobacteria bacterium]|nr:hypothetical protein [Alphaproteobacteria bacterium]